MKIYKTTMGSVDWDEYAYSVNHFDDPVPPEEGNWKLVGSVLGALRNTSQPIFWFWEKEE